MAKYCWEETQVLSRQKISLLLLPHRRNNVNVTGAKPLCAYYSTWRLGQPPGGKLNTEVYKAESNHWQTNLTKIRFYWLSSLRIDILSNDPSFLMDLIYYKLMTCQMLVHFRCSWFSYDWSLDNFFSNGIVGDKKENKYSYITRVTWTQSYMIQHTKCMKKIIVTISKQPKIQDMLWCFYNSFVSVQI